MVQGPGERIPSTSFASGAYGLSDDQGATLAPPVKIPHARRPSHDFRLVVDTTYCTHPVSADGLARNQALHSHVRRHSGRIHVAQCSIRRRRGAGCAVAASITPIAGCSGLTIRIPLSSTERASGCSSPRGVSNGSRFSPSI
jgi:hypothetical protein